VLLLLRMACFFTPPPALLGRGGIIEPALLLGLSRLADRGRVPAMNGSCCFGDGRYVPGRYSGTGSATIASPYIPKGGMAKKSDGL